MNCAFLKSFVFIVARIEHIDCEESGQAKRYKIGNIIYQKNLKVTIDVRLSRHYRHTRVV